MTPVDVLVPAYSHTHMCPHTCEHTPHNAHSCTCREEIKFYIREKGNGKVILELRAGLNIRHSMEVFGDP